MDDFFLSFLIFKDFTYLLLERGEERMKGRETSKCKRNQLPVPHPQLGTRPATQTCALTGTMPNQMSHTSQGKTEIFR